MDPAERGRSARTRRAFRDRAHLFDPDRGEEEPAQEYTRPPDSRAYRKLRASVLRTHPICQLCHIRPATRVDHIIPLSQGGPFMDPENLQALCKDCDKRKTAGDARGRSVSHRHRVGPDGLPSAARDQRREGLHPPPGRNEGQIGEEQERSGILARADFREKVGVRGPILTLGGLISALERLRGGSGSLETGLRAGFLREVAHEIRSDAQGCRREPSMWGRLHSVVGECPWFPLLSPLVP